MSRTQSLPLAMPKRLTALVFASTLLGTISLPAPLLAQTDRDVIVRADTGKNMIVDKVVAETYKEVKYETRAGERTLAADKIKEILYHDVPDAYKNGLEFLAKGEYENALNSFQLALEKKGIRDWIKTYGLYQAAKTYQQWGLTAKEKLKDAIQSYEKLLREYPETRFYPEALYNLAATYASSGDLPNALKTFDRLGQDSYDKKFGVSWEARAKYERALAELNGGLLEDSERDFRSAMTFAAEQSKTAAKDDPALAAALARIANLSRLNQGSVMIKKNKIREARQFFEEITKDPAGGREAKAGAACGLGECLLAEKKLKEAQDQFARARVLYFDIPEESARAAFHLGLICLELKDSEPNFKQTAKEYFQEVIDLYPETGWAAMARTRLE